MKPRVVAARNDSTTVRAFNRPSLFEQCITYCRSACPRAVGFATRRAAQRPLSLNPEAESWDCLTMCDVRRFFASKTPVAEEEVAWLGGTIRLRLRVYLTDEMPPLDYVSSVRAVVVPDAGCAVLRNADGVHVLPGGRREPDETLRETLCREIGEETGCRVATSQPSVETPG